MKKLFITSLLTILTLPAFAENAANPFDNATTKEEAWTIFEDKASAILKESKAKLKNSEYSKLEKQYKNMLEDKNEKTSKKDKKKKDEEQNKKKLSPEEQEQKISELRDNAEAMKEKEQSFENKALGAAAIGTTGMGAMELASGLAEKTADEDAERSMKAYLATFTCKYGDKRVKGGTMNVELPGGNELINLYSEYVTLANDLKVRKNALGMLPGIESESILDKSTSGLYDDVNIGKTGGAYTSLARALMDPTGEDAQKWNAEKQASADKVKKGATAAGLGAIGGLIGNLAINGKSPKERSEEINKKYEPLKKEFTEVQEEIEEKHKEKLTKETCAKYDAVGENIESSCSCSDENSYWDSNNIQCTSCEEDQIVNEDKTSCIPKPGPSCELQPGNLTDENCACINEAEKDENNACVCNLTGTFNANSCECNEHSTKNGNACACDSNYKPDPKAPTTCIPEVAEVVAAEEPIQTFSFPSDTFFDVGKATLKDDAGSLLKKITDVIKQKYPDKAAEILASSCFTINGYADRTGNYKKNQTLSESRAHSVAKALVTASGGKITNNSYVVSGKGDTECTRTDYPKKADLAKCRRVDIVLNSGSCSAPVAESGDGAANKANTIETATKVVTGIIKK